MKIDKIHREIDSLQSKPVCCITSISLIVPNAHCRPLASAQSRKSRLEELSGQTGRVYQYGDEDGTSGLQAGQGVRRISRRGRDEQYALNCQLGLRRLLTVASLPGKEVKRLQEEQRATRRIIEQQNLSVEDIRRITAEEDQLRKTVSALTDRLNDSRKLLAEAEVQVTRRSEDADEAISTYETLLVQCGLQPPPLPAPIENAQLDITLDTAQSDPQKMCTADIRGSVLPAIMAYRSAKAQEKVELSSKLDDLKQELEKLQGEMDDTLDRIRDHEEQKAAIEQSVETAKTVCFV